MYLCADSVPKLELAAITGPSVVNALSAYAKSRLFISTHVVLGDAGMLPLQFCEEIGDPLCLYVLSEYGFTPKQQRAVKATLATMREQEKRAIEDYHATTTGSNGSSKAPKGDNES